MAWSSAVTDKQFSNGVYLVTVNYTDGTKTVSETYRTTVPSENWIPRMVAARLAQLEVSGTFDISLGPVTPLSPPAADPNIELFRERCRILGVVKILIDLGLILPTNAKVVALGNWIKNNFDTYVDLL